jgi:hypothetical protein
MEDTFQFSSRIEESGNNLWGFHFQVPELIAKSLIQGDDRRVVCLLESKIEYQCAMIPKGDGSFIIMVNKKTRDKLGLKPGSPVQVQLHKDESQYGLPIPEELEEVLRQDETGNRIFHALTPGKIRTLLYIAGQPKTSDTRLRRALAIVEHLKNNAGKINYRQLNEEMRRD